MTEEQERLGELLALGMLDAQQQKDKASFIYAQLLMDNEAYYKIVVQASLLSCHCQLSARQVEEDFHLDTCLVGQARKLL